MTDKYTQEELVRKIMIVVSKYSLYLDFTHDEAKAEISKLLPPRPSVTRGEIARLAESIRYVYSSQSAVYGKLWNFLKSKGIEVKGGK